MAEPFSALSRENLCNKLRHTHYDVLVIGGGITGAGIALDAATRGLKTALVEKRDFAFGTSSRSTKLIHGGLRYLKQLEFGLVKEVGSERAVVHRLAPHLVVPEKMLLPLYEKKGLGYWLTSIGLMVYDFLAGVRRSDQRRMLTRAQTLRREPLLAPEGVKGSALYAEYRTDDARLTLEIAKTAAAQGAHVINYTRVYGFVYESGSLAGAEVVDELSGSRYTISSDVVVSAAGPWVDELRQMDESQNGKRLHLTRGVHVVFRREKLPVKQAVYFQVEDGRMIFAIPRGRTTYVGTTDTNYDGDKDTVITTREDAEYLLRGINSTFREVELTLDDIESSWAGLRPLIHEEGKATTELSRRDEIFVSPSGLISIAGGKLTGYRKMAERVVNLIVKKRFPQRRLKKCSTANLPLAGAGFVHRREVRKYRNTVREALKPYSLRQHLPDQLVETFGKQTDHILNYFLNHPMPDDPELGLLLAQAWFTIRHEMTVSADDFFVRRTGLLFFDIHQVMTYKQAVASFMKEQLSWDDATWQRELKKVDDAVAEATSCRSPVSHPG